jgi:hypothetical protein
MDQRMDQESATRNRGVWVPPFGKTELVGRRSLQRFSLSRAGREFINGLGAKNATLPEGVSPPPCEGGLTSFRRRRANSTPPGRDVGLLALCQARRPWCHTAKFGRDSAA